MAGKTNEWHKVVVWDEKIADVLAKYIGGARDFHKNGDLQRMDERWTKAEKCRGSFEGLKVR